MFMQAEDDFGFILLNVSSRLAGRERGLKRFYQYQARVQPPECLLQMAARPPEGVSNGDTFDTALSILRHPHPDLGPQVPRDDSNVKLWVCVMAAIPKAPCRIV
jgi:hypothetical protein